MKRPRTFLTALALVALPGPAVAEAASGVASFDLLTDAGVAAVAGEWRVAEARLVPADFRRAGGDGQPGTEPSATFEIEPKAGVAGFDDSAWPVVAPAALAHRIGPGKVSFAWYRFRFTVPETFAGRSAIFEVVIDDAAEVWVDGELRRCPGQTGGSMLAGWGAPNRVVAARRATAGQVIEIAVFAVNGPISASPTNYLWMKSARLELVEGEVGPVAVPACEENVEVVRFADPHHRLDAILTRNPKLFLIGEGFTFTEGPVWSPRDAALLFSDPNENRIYRWSAQGGLEVFREKSGYDGVDVARYRQPGSNGLAIDRAGRLAVAQHGHRRIVRLDTGGGETVVAERSGGRRLNSPNDLVYRADGSLYFTDPFFGLPGFGDDPAKELPYQGVYRVHEGEVELLAGELAGPNGLAFSPDERFLYVGDWDDAFKAVVRYPVLEDGRLGPGETFLDLTREPGEDALDGVETDELGNVYVSGPGGLWIVAPDGTRLARIETPRHVHNLAWGEDGTVLYLAARDHLYRMPLRVRGHAPHLAPAQASENPEYPNVDRDGVILDGYDPVAFFTDGEPVRGLESIRSSYRGAIYQFASQEHKALFEADPAKYEPQFGAWCAYAVSQGRTAPIQIETWSIVEGRLVLQHNARAVSLWQQDPVKFLHLADEYWPAVVANDGKQIDVDAEK